MKDMTISQMLGYQRELHELHKDCWTPHTPEYAHTYLLYSIEEIGECIAIIKKKGDESIMENGNVRRHFIEETADAMMYWLDMLDSYGIDAEEFCTEYKRKVDRNMKRTWAENEAMYED